MLAVSVAEWRISVSGGRVLPSGEWIVIHLFVANIPYSRRGHDEQKARLGWQIYRKVARQNVNPA